MPAASRESDNNYRYVSRLTRDTMALILAGGRGSRLHELTAWRAKPALYFGGKFRIIDFPLSNCINSGIRRVGVLTQYKAHSLIRHLISGWTHFRRELGEFVEVLPASQRASEDWYKGTADAVFQNLDIIRSENPEYVIVLAGDHVYKMDYGAMIAAHVRADADMTVGCVPVAAEDAANSLGVMTVNDNHRVVRFDEKPAEPASIPGRPGVCLASMGIYVFNTSFLMEQLIRDADDPRSSHDFGFNIIPHIVDRYRIFAHSFKERHSDVQSYWRDVGTLDGYWDANMDLVEPSPELNIYDAKWPIWTYQAQLPPAKFVFDDPGRRGYAVDSMVGGGSIISGSEIKKSLLFSDVTVHSYSKVSASVILPEVDIGRHCRLDRCIVDRGCRLPPGTEIGVDHEADAERGFRVTPGGVVLVTPEMLGQFLHLTR